jgi:ATP-dependent helicase/nuclease subunit A
VEGSGNSLLEKQLNRWKKRLIEYAQKLYHSCFILLKRDDLSDKTWILLEEEDRKLSGVVESAWPEKEVLSVSFDRLPPNRNKTEEYERMEEARKSVKNIVEKVRGFSFSEEDIKISADLSAKICRSLYTLLAHFDEIFSLEKKRKNILDFSDVERYAHQLLMDANGNPTAIAGETAAQYDQIYIDEYQDSNRIQDDIFRMISQNNRFMVGDIKQSIYGFRGAVPDLFSNYRKLFPDWDSTQEQKNGKIFLSDNFRSDRSILEFVNLVFCHLFGHDSQRVAYSEEQDSLRFPEQKEEGKNEPVEIKLIRSSGEDSSSLGEVRYVARRIQKMIANGTSPSDIAILLRSPGRHAEKYEKELRKLGIPTESSATDSFFESPEILLMLSLLGAIDNPRRDIYLAGAMKSPLFGITLDDLIMLHRNYPSDCLYGSLTAALEKGDFAQGKEFMEWLQECRKIAGIEGVDRLIRHIYRKNSLPSIVGFENAAGVNRLRRFYDFALRFESVSFRGLHRFMRYLADSRNERKMPEVVKSVEEKQCVHILSIHHSKGLEYPVVFLAETGRKCNFSDLNSSVLMDKELGMAFLLKDSTGYGKYDSYMRRVVATRLEENLVDEEFRVLYVAMTRAKRKLILTATDKDPKKLLSDCKAQHTIPDFYRFCQDRSIIRWVLSALPSDYLASHSEIMNFDLKKENEVESSQKAETPQQSVSEEMAISLECVKKRTQFVYPYLLDTQLLSKASVSHLTPDYLDENVESTTDGDYQRILDQKPSFLQGAGKASPAERGTATHLFMQFCDFGYTEKNGVEMELARLVQNSFLPAESAKLVNIQKINSFFQSNLYKNLSVSPEIKREYRFIVKLPASRFSQQEERKEELNDSEILVQGIIDCFFKLPDGSYQLLDYKTDALTGDRECAISRLKEEYTSQLQIYKEAISLLTGQTVSRVSIFALDIGEEIPLELP